MADIFSFQRIAEHNGWSMAGLGITIDLLGLTLLAIIISQVPKLVGLIEKIKGLFQKSPTDTADNAPEADNQVGQTPVYDLSLDGIKEVGALYKEKTNELGDSFELTALYHVSDKLGLPHPHLTIKSLREAGLLQPEGDRRFAWNL